MSLEDALPSLEWVEMLLAKRLVQIYTAAVQEQQTDIAYACVELLPSELKAQLEGFPKHPVLQQSFLSPFSGPSQEKNQIGDIK